MNILLKDFRDLTNWGGKTILNDSGAIPWTGVPRCIKKEKANWELVFISLCFPPMGAMQPVTLSFDIFTTMGHTF